MPIPTVDQVARPQAWGYDGYIDNVLIRVAVSPREILETLTAPASPPKVDTAASAEDIRDETGQRYSRSDLTGGAGLDFLHAPNPKTNAATRFWDSKGIDVFTAEPGKPYTVKLLHDITQDAGNAATFIRLLRANDTTHFMYDNVLYEYPSTAQHTFTGATMIDVAYAGNAMYFLDNTNGVSRISPAISYTPAAMSATIYDAIWAVKGRVVAANDNTLYEIVEGGADVLIDTLTTGETFADVIDVGSVAMALCSDGTIRSYTLNSTQNLELQSITRVTGESPFMAIESQGVIVYTTVTPTEAGGWVTRIYTAEQSPDDQNALVNQQLIFQRGDRSTTDDLRPTAMLPTRDSVYIAIPEEGSNEVCLWRFYLPTFGYARDLCFDFSSALSVDDLIEVDDRMMAAVGGNGLWKEQDTYVLTGYIIGPLADFFTAEPKQWVNARISGLDITTGESVELFDTTEPALLDDPYSPSWRLVAFLNDGETDIEVDALPARNGRYHASKVVLRGEGTTTPEWSAYSVRALPSPTRDILVRIPINVSDQFETPGRRPLVRKGRGKELEEALRQFEGAQVTLGLYRPEMQFRGQVEELGVPVDYIPKRGSVTRVLWATIRGRRVTDAAGIVTRQTLKDSLGQDLLGRVVLGQGDPLV